jgi:UDP-GlcNAc3NAcA epimerase
MYDASLFFAEKAERASSVLDRLRLEPGGYCLATVHRAENTDRVQRLAGILQALREVSRLSPSCSRSARGRAQRTTRRAST